MEQMQFNGWDCVRLSNRDVEVIVTRAVGPRVIRFAFKEQANVFAELQGQQGGTGETAWMIRGGHRFWIAPEADPWSYEPDNVPVSIDAIEGGVRTRQPAGPVTQIAKQMEIRLSADQNRVDVLHTLTNEGNAAVEAAPWALSVMGLEGQAIIPLPRKIAHTERLTHNQHWSIWGYTDFTDPRWTLGSQFILFRQDPTRGPNKLGIAHREGWVAYQREGFLFVKQFAFDENATYPDDGCTFETFSNEEILEIESLGALVTLAPGDRVAHAETWWLFRDVPRCETEQDVVEYVMPLIDPRRSNP